LLDVFSTLPVDGSTLRTAFSQLLTERAFFRDLVWPYLRELCEDTARRAADPGLDGICSVLGHAPGGSEPPFFRDFERHS
jgi:hypothetical protein